MTRPMVGHVGHTRDTSMTGRASTRPTAGHNEGSIPCTGEPLHSSGGTTASAGTMVDIGGQTATSAVSLIEPTTHSPGQDASSCHGGRWGKAPPVDPFNGESPELRLDDCLPNLERASLWNGWTDGELLLQCAGHLRGQALLEWNLLDVNDKKTYQSAIEALQSRLDPGGRALAAQDFCHTFQRDTESVGDFIRRLERTFQLAYG